RLRVVFGIRGDVDMEPVLRFVADETHELVRIAEIADVRAAGRQVSAQRDEMPDAVTAILREDLAHAVARRADAGYVRSAFHPFGTDLEDGGERAFARRSARAVRHRAESGLQRSELASRGAELGDSIRCFGRKELEAIECGLRTERHGRPRRISDDSAHEMML